VQRFLWWKKYLTKMQMVQFVVFFIHALQPLFIECHYPKVIISSSAPCSPLLDLVSYVCISASTRVPFRPTAVQMPNLALIEKKRM
jgi:hypothetical protein